MWKTSVTCTAICSQIDRGIPFSVYPSSAPHPGRYIIFYENLASIIRNIPCKEQVVVLGDFNARVGVDHDSWPSCLGQFGVGKMNENGQRLLELCTFHDLCITNSLWHWHQLDLILVRRAAIKNVLHTRSYHSADCDTDHSLVCCKIRMQPKKFHHTKTKGVPRFDISKMSQPDFTEQFAQTCEKEPGSLQPGDSATEKWGALHDTMYRTALATFGKRSSKSHDSFEAKSTVMTPITEVKRAALAEYKRTPSERNLQILRIARSKAQQTARRCANEFIHHSSRLCPSTAGCSPSSMSSIFVCLLLF